MNTVRAKAGDAAQLRAADIEDAACAAALNALGGGPAEAAYAAIRAADGFMQEYGRIPEIAKAMKGAACAKGCGWCCHQVVGLTVAEEAMVGEAIAKLPSPQRSAVLCRAQEANKTLSEIPPEQWQAQRIPCPLLDNNSCLIHSARPLPCRAVFSTDVSACRRWRQGEDGAKIPLLAVPRRVYSLAQAGLAQALASSGIPPGPVSLIEALTILG